MFKNMTTWLKGRKCYLVCAVAILSAVLAYLSDAMTGTQMIEAIFAAITAATIRAGVAKGPEVK